MAEVENKTVAGAEDKQEEPAVVEATPAGAEVAAADQPASESAVPAATDEVTAAPATEPVAETKAAKAEKAAKPLVHTPNFEKDVVYLYQFVRNPLLPSISPYCLRVETWLRLTGLKYENVDHKMKCRPKRGQYPFIELNGQQIDDSTIIIKELSTKFSKDLDAGLTQEQRNISHAMISMINNSLNWANFWWRSKYPDRMLKGYQVNLQHALSSKIPNSLLTCVFKIHFGRQGTKKAKAQGIGVYKEEEIIEFGKNDLRVLSEMLADKPFFFGDEPSSLDCASFSLLAQIYFISDEAKHPLKEFMIEQCPNLVGHVSRMKERCFPDWDDICKNLDLNAHLPKPAPEVKENKEGADTEKAAEQDKNDSEKELAKDKVDDKIEENKEKEAEAQ